jgi:hypothetical protein
MSCPRTINKGNGMTQDGWLDNVHPGDILRNDYLIGIDIPVIEVAMEGNDPRHIVGALGLELTVQKKAA